MTFFSIQHQCPQCGAPALLQETDRLMTCRFCKVRSVLMFPEGMRTVLPVCPSAADKPLMYVPYWRYKGIVFTCLNTGIQDRFVDFSVAAVSSVRFPRSVGLRSQALQLRYVTPDLPGRFVKPATPKPDMLTALEWIQLRETGPAWYFRSAIGDVESLLYAPFYLDRKLFDAVVDRAISPVLAEDDEVFGLGGEAPDPSIGFLPALCPTCGWDLRGERDSICLDCPNCQTLWAVQPSGLHSLPFGYVKPTGPADGYLPFWRIQAAVGGFPLESVADLIRAANLPRVVKATDADRPFYFWAPAFKIQAKSLMHLARGLTLMQPQWETVAEHARAGHRSVNLSAEEAVETIRLNMAGWITPRQKLLPALAEAPIDAFRQEIVFVPFTAGFHELALADTPIRIPNAHIQLSGNL